MPIHETSGLCLYHFFSACAPIAIAMFTVVLNPDNPPGRLEPAQVLAVSLRPFSPLAPASIDQAMDFSQPAKLSRNPPHIISRPNGFEPI